MTDLPVDTWPPRPPGRAQFRVIQVSGLAPDEELAAAPKCVWHAIVECVPASLAQVAAFGRRWLHEDKEPSATDDWGDRVNPRRANAPKCCQVGRGSRQTFGSELRQLRCLGLEVIPIRHESHSANSTISQVMLARPSLECGSVVPRRCSGSVVIGVLRPQEHPTQHLLQRLEHLARRRDAPSFGSWGHRMTKYRIPFDEGALWSRPVRLRHEAARSNCIEDTVGRRVTVTVTGRRPGTGPVAVTSGPDRSGGPGLQRRTVRCRSWDRG